jgi:hypothetical protein
MALFARREIQHRIDEASAFVSADKLDGLVRRLNLENKQAIEAQWELAWLTALCRVGDVGYEVAMPSGTRFPDIHFKQGSFSFVVDVTSVSDVGYQQENPIDEFSRAIDQLYRKYQAAGGFSVTIESEVVGSYGNSRVKLFIPGRSEVHAFIRRHFSDFVCNAVANPELPSNCSAEFEGRAIAMAYNPKQRPYYHGPSHLSPNVPYSAKRNPVHNALKAKKEQLKKSGFIGLKGIVLCDASCRTLTASSGGSGFSLRDILARFSAGTRSVDFILTIGVEEQHGTWARDATYRFIPYLHLRDGLDATEKKNINRVFNLALKHLPSPKRAGYQALYQLDHGSPPSAWHTGITGSFELPGDSHTMKIKLSSRRLLALIAGEITAEEFRSNYSLPQGSNNTPLDILARAIKDGRMIEDARVEPNFDEDDDHIVLVLGALDAASAKFRRPGALRRRGSNHN